MREHWTRRLALRGRALLRGKRFEEDPSRGLSPGKKAVGSVPAPYSPRPQSSGRRVGVGGLTFGFLRSGQERRTLAGRK